MLSPAQIEKLASRKGVNRIAVENFLSTLDGMTWYEAVGNVEFDARAYRWNRETTAAIREGLVMYFRQGR